MMDRRQETKLVKKALKDAGIKARVTHGKGTAWGWLEINVGDPKTRIDGLEPHPSGHGTRYTMVEKEMHARACRIAKEVTGRRGEYDGNILILAQEV